MHFKFTLVAAALLIAAPAVAQPAPQTTANFILGHGFFPPPAQPSSHYPPGHAMANAPASMRGDTTTQQPTAQSRNGTDEVSHAPSVAPARKN
jgi:hypothetical protein